MIFQEHPSNHSKLCRPERKPAELRSKVRSWTLNKRCSQNLEFCMWKICTLASGIFSLVPEQSTVWNQRRGNNSNSGSPVALFRNVNTREAAYKNKTQLTSLKPKLLISTAPPPLSQITTTPPSCRQQYNKQLQPPVYKPMGIQDGPTRPVMWTYWPASPAEPPPPLSLRDPSHFSMSGTRNSSPLTWSHSERTLVLYMQLRNKQRSRDATMSCEMTACSLV